MNLDDSKTLTYHWASRRDNSQHDIHEIKWALRHHVHEEPLLYPCQRLCVPHPVKYRPSECVVDDVRLTNQSVWCPGCAREERLQKQKADLLV
jgi:hypothetical protein